MARVVALTFAAALVLGRAHADPAAMEIWPSGPVPGEDGFVCGPEAVITTVGPYASARRFYNVSRPTLTPYIVTNGSGAAVVIAPGGGYSHLAYDDEGTRVAARLNAGGVSVLLLKYRVPLRPTAPGAFWAAAQLMDAQRAMGVARLHAAELGFNASRLGFGGFSAGGHLSARAANIWETRLYARVDAADDLPCRPDFSFLIYPWMLLDNNNASSHELSPELNVTAAHPPAFIAQNMDDVVALPDGALTYTSALHAAHAPPPVVHLYPKGGHGFGVCAELNPVGAFELCCEWPVHALRFMQGLGLAPGWPNKTQA